MRSSSGTTNGEASSPEGVDVRVESNVGSRTMDKVHDAIAWYQKKIGSYDKQLWEQSVEKKLQKSHFLHNAPRKSVRMKTEYIDVDLIRGSTFAKTKPQVPWVYVTRKAAARIIFYPFYYTWWVHQTSVQMYFLLLVLYVMQVATTVVYIRNFDHSILEDEMSFTEVILPALLMFLLCIIHSQTVLAHITHKPPKRSKEISRVVRKPKMKKPGRRGHRSSGNNSSACPDDSGADHRRSRRPSLIPSPLSASPPLSASSSVSPLKVTPTGLAARISISNSSQKPSLQSSDSFAQQISRRSSKSEGSSSVKEYKQKDVCLCESKEVSNGLSCDPSSNIQSSEHTSERTSISNQSSVPSTSDVSSQRIDQSTDLGSVQSSAKSSFPSIALSSDWSTISSNVQGSEHLLTDAQKQQTTNSCNSIRVNTELSKASEGSGKNVCDAVRKECEDSGCDAVCDSIDTVIDGPKVQRGMSIDSFSGHSDFELVDHRAVSTTGETHTKAGNSPQPSLPSAACVVLSNKDSPSIIDNTKEDVCKVNSSNTMSHKQQTHPSLGVCIEESGQSSSLSLSQVHQVEDPLNPVVKCQSQCGSSPDYQTLPKIVIQQPVVPSDSSHNPSSPGSSFCSRPAVSDRTSSGQAKVQLKASKDFQTSSQDSIQKAAEPEGSQPDSSQLHCFSEMFVKKILDEEALLQVSGSDLLATSDLENSSSSISHLSTSSSNSVPSDHQQTKQPVMTAVKKQLATPSSLHLEESIDHNSDGGHLSDSNYNPSDSESDDLRGRCEERGKRLRFHETVVSGPTGRSDQDVTDSRCNLRRRRRISGSHEVTEVKPMIRSRPSSLGLRPHGVKGKQPSSSENETGGAAETPEGSTKAAMSSEEWEDRIQSDETTSSAYTSSCGEGESDGEEEDKSEYTTSTLHVINLLHPQSGTTNSAGTVSQPDKVSCVIWEGNECKKVDLTALDIGWAIIDKVDSLPESSDYFLIGLLFSVLMSCMPLVYRGFSCKEEINWNEVMSLPGSLPVLGLKLYSFFGDYSWRELVVMVNGILQRLVLSLIFFFLLSVADRTFKQRLLYAKHFSYLTSSRRARKFSMPHFRLNKVRNIKIWLSLRSYLKRRGPQRSVDVIVSACFMSAVCVVCLISIQMLKDTEVYLDYLCNWELMVWCLALGVFLMRFMTLGLKINKKYRNLSVLITEQINLYLQMEQKPHKKDELILANNVLRLAEDLLKELESPFKISGFSANPLIYNIMRVVVLSAFSAVLTEVLGFKLKLYKIKLKA